MNKSDTYAFAGPYCVRTEPGGELIDEERVPGISAADRQPGDCADAPAAGNPTLHDDFGVSHPEQIVYFEPGSKLDPKHVSMLDEQGKPVPFQVPRDGRIAVRTALPAGTTKHWKLMAQGAQGYACSRGTRRSLTAFAAEPVEELGLRLAGGPAEIVLEEHDGTLTHRPSNRNLHTKRAEARLVLGHMASAGLAQSGLDTGWR